MSKKVLSMLLVLCMVLTSIATLASCADPADDPAASDKGTQAPGNENNNDPTEGNGDEEDDFDAEAYDKTCKKIKEIGYQLVQISGTPLKANEMRCVLEQYGFGHLARNSRIYRHFVRSAADLFSYLYSTAR